MILDRFTLDGRVALVTGAGKGIGAGIARGYAEAGADLVLASRTLADVEAVAEEARALGRKATAIACDVTDREQLEALVARAIEAHGRIDVLVNNAGGAPHVPLLKTSERVFEEALRFNVTQAFLLSRLCAPHLLATERGAIINISSSLGRIVGRGFVAYGTAKAALQHMTRLMASELAPKVRVNAICCGAIATDALQGFLKNDAVRQGLIGKTPLRRVGEVEEIAATALYLASDAGAYMTGRILAVDGGIEISNTPFDLPDL